MRAYLWEKVERARQEPEHIRRRYVYICLAVSMIFVLGIWFLSLREGLGTVSQALPDISELKPHIPLQESEQSLIQKQTPLDVPKNEQNGNDFFNSQMQEKQNTTQGEGITPQ